MRDLITFGETMLRLSPPDDGRLETAPAFDVTVGGAESNVAIAVSRLGHATGWLSRLPNSPLGRRIVGELRRHGVEAYIDWTTDGRVGTYYLESGEKPRDIDVFYDRRDSAITDVDPEVLPLHEVRSATVFHTSGITPALSKATAEATQRLLTVAADAGTTVSFDLNYRSKLWTSERARDVIEPLLDHVDLLFAPVRDVGTVLGISDTAETMGATLTERFDIETVVLTRGEKGALAYHADTAFEQPAYRASDRRPIGSGDAFVGGFLAKFLDDAPLSEALSWGAGTAALKRSIPGDAAIITPDEVQSIVDGSTSPIDR